MNLFRRKRTAKVPVGTIILVNLIDKEGEPSNMLFHSSPNATTEGIHLVILKNAGKRVITDIKFYYPQ